MRPKHFTQSFLSIYCLFLLLGPATTANAAPLSCTFVSGISNGSLAFGNIDPSSAGTLYATVTQQVSFSCTKNNVVYTIAVAPAAGWTLTSGGNTISYTLGVAPSGTTGLAGTPVALLLAPPNLSASSIIPANYQNAPGGLYRNAGAVTITVSPAGTTSLTATIPINNVSATVINTCAVTQTAGTLTFNIDPSVSGTTAATISPDLKIKCTKNDSISITTSSTCGGASPKMGLGGCGGSSFIPYAFTTSPSPGTTGLGFGAGTDITLGIGGSASSANYANAPVGSYSDIETVTINY